MITAERKREIQKAFKERNPDAQALTAKRYRERNKAKVSEIGKKYRRKYYTNATYRITVLNRSRVLAALKGLNKAESTTKMLGCTVEELKAHLESLFQPRMSWDNHGEWHIDHIKPCSKFDLTDPEQQKICFHYTNLQPLWAIDNIRKSNK